MPAPAHELKDVLKHQEAEERERALRALLMRPLMAAGDPALELARRHAGYLHDWFGRETGWNLQVERQCARLYKRPAALDDPTRGLPDFDQDRYVLLCLACAVLEHAESQITLRTLGERLVIGNFVMREFGAEPWRFGAADYLSATADHRIALRGDKAVVA